MTIAVASALLVLSPAMNAQAQMYENQYEYNNNNNDHKTKKSSDVNTQKIKCINSNINVNGIDINQIPTDDLTTTETSYEGADATGAQNGNGLSDSLNVERNLVNVCVNVNQNDQLKVEPAEETATLTVNKEVFGCSNVEGQPPFQSMSCQTLQDGSSSWLPCIGSTITDTPFCQNLPPNFFDIEVLDDQDTLIQQFEGSTAGTTIQNLEAGTYAVNEIKSTSGFDQLQSSTDGEIEQSCISRGFDGGGILVTIPEPTLALTYFICFEYEDEQGNDCSDVTLAAGEDKTCTVKNYMSLAAQGD